MGNRHTQFPAHTDRGNTSSHHTAVARTLVVLRCTYICSQISALYDEGPTLSCAPAMYHEHCSRGRAQMAKAGRAGWSTESEPVARPARCSILERRAHQGPRDGEWTQVSFPDGPSPPPNAPAAGRVATDSQRVNGYKNCSYLLYGLRSRKRGGGGGAHEGPEVGESTHPGCPPIRTEASPPPGK